MILKNIYLKVLKINHKMNNQAKASAFSSDNS